jgi:hypothetical protein
MTAFSEPNNGFTGVPISNKTILLISSLGFGALGIVLFVLLRRRQSTIDYTDRRESGRNAYGELLDQSNVATLNRAQRKAKARLQVKRLQRTVAPVQHQRNNADEVQEQEVEGVDLENVANLDLVEVNLSRKERRKAAKEMEREERKTYAEEARLWREKHHSTNSFSRVKCKNISPSDTNDLSLEKMIEEIFPQCLSEDDDPLSYVLFWGSIVNKIKQTAFTYEDMISSVQQQRTITIYQLIERLKLNKSISILSLSEEFGIEVDHIMHELEAINKRFGIIGIVDNNGNFVYISIDMIKQAIQFGESIGRVPCPRSAINISTLRVESVDERNLDEHVTCI